MNWSIESTKDLLRQLFVWNNNEVQTMQRAGLAKSLGLDPSAYVRPFPGSNVNTYINNTPATPPPAPPPTPPAPVVPATPTPPPSSAPGLSKLATGGILAALLAGALGTGAGAWSLLRPAPAVTPPAATTPAPALPPGYDWRLKWWIENGTPKSAIEQLPAPQGKQP